MMKEDSEQTSEGLAGAKKIVICNSNVIILLQLRNKKSRPSPYVPLPMMSTVLPPPPPAPTPIFITLEYTLAALPFGLLIESFSTF